MFFNNPQHMDVEAEIEKIKSRNKRVEGDKAWETSTERRLLITLGTYVLSYLLFILINAPNPHLAAVVPAMAFLLSTLTMPLIKETWLRNRK
jgi:Mn2+/Fe2+ NRAMP family transporter